MHCVHVRALRRSSLCTFERARYDQVLCTLYDVPRSDLDVHSTKLYLYVYICHMLYTLELYLVYVLCRAVELPCTLYAQHTVAARSVCVQGTSYYVQGSATMYYVRAHSSTMYKYKVLQTTRVGTNHYLYIHYVHSCTTG